MAINLLPRTLFKGLRAPQTSKVPKVAHIAPVFLLDAALAKWTFSCLHCGWILLYVFILSCHQIHSDVRLGVKLGFRTYYIAQIWLHLMMGPRKHELAHVWSNLMGL